MPINFVVIPPHDIQNPWTDFLENIMEGFDKTYWYVLVMFTTGQQSLSVRPNYVCG
jgi:hypothetical protein